MTTNRDTQFVGFAEKLYEELAQNVVASDKGLSDVEAFKQEQYRIIAQRAYDLAVHVASFMTQPELVRMWAGMLSPRQVIERIPIPDMIEWPEEHTD